METYKLHSVSFKNRLGRLGSKQQVFFGSILFFLSSKLVFEQDVWLDGVFRFIHRFLLTISKLE